MTLKRQRLCILICKWLCVQGYIVKSCLDTKYTHLFKIALQQSGTTHTWGQDDTERHQTRVIRDHRCAVRCVHTPEIFRPGHQREIFRIVRLTLFRWIACSRTADELFNYWLSLLNDQSSLYWVNITIHVYQRTFLVREIKGNEWIRNAHIENNPFFCVKQTNNINIINVQ